MILLETVYDLNTSEIHFIFHYLYFYFSLYTLQNHCSFFLSHPPHINYCISQKFQYSKVSNYMSRSYLWQYFTLIDVLVAPYINIYLPLSNNLHKNKFLFPSVYTPISLIHRKILIHIKKFHWENTYIKHFICQIHYLDQEPIQWPYIKVRQQKSNILFTFIKLFAFKLNWIDSVYFPLILKFGL